ncbi:MAG: PBS lyase, partial [Candidatus Parcubacteria bacterium]|nr:PBS lyase [Leptolyngbyaceae cyanobacterium LF-bin-113]
ADTRAKITQFVETYFKGNIIMTTQPLEWLPPSTAKIYQLQPLRSDQIQDFLLSRGAIVAPSSDNKKSSTSERSHTQSPPILGDLGGECLSADKYTHDCCTYLDEVLNDRQPPEELAAIQRTLSNPMDLTVVAQMIALGKQPNLLRLQEQQYNLMAAEYQQQWSQDFPLKKFSEAVYQLRLNDEKALPADEFYQELVSMEDEKYKMVVSRQWKDAKGEAQHEWYFRHDKIMEFFIVQTFLGDSTTAQNRLLDHMSDPRFRGVYFLLATLLPLPDAKDLRERLIQYAADTKDHTVSDTFVQLLRTR